MKLEKLLILVSLVVPFGGSLTGCAASADDAPADEQANDEADLKAGKAIRLTEANDGAEVEIQQGQSIVVKLGANATTGYAWSVQSVDRTFGYPTMKYTPSAPSRIGSGGSTTLTWKANPLLAAGGSHEVVLSYSRGTPKPSDEKFTFTVKVVDKSPAIGTEGGMCGGFAGFACKAGLVCKDIPRGGFDMPGKCRKP
jgi:predicted secreted protein